MAQKFEQLLESFLRETISLDDLEVFLKEVKSGQHDKVIKEFLDKKLTAHTYTGLSHTLDWDEKFDEMMRRAAQLEQEVEVPAHTRKVFRMRPWIVAASVAILVILGGYFLLVQWNRNLQNSTIAVKDVQAPQSSKAMITLADGSKVYLDSLNSGRLAVQGNMQVVKLANGQIAYQSATESMSAAPQYNTLTNPKGSKVIDIVLSDNSHVWLNAGSSLTYPVLFTGKERDVELLGEGYFEVAKDPLKKFNVMANGVRTEVLGTHFNINTFNNKDNVAVTLMEGSVRVSHKNLTSVIKPGQQARIRYRTERPIAILEVDIDDVIAWKYNEFRFSGIKIQEVMEQIANWYNVNIEYRGVITSEDFIGAISRSGSLSQVLQLLEITKKVRFEIKGKTVIVMPP